MYLVTASTPLDDLPIGYHMGITAAREQCEKLVAMGEDTALNEINAKGPRTGFSQVHGFVIWDMRRGEYGITQYETAWFNDDN